MPDTTPKLSLPLILPAQAQKHVTHNEAIRTLDIVAQLSVLSDQAASPPAAAQDGEAHIVAGGAAGDWAGQTGRIAMMEGGAWQFLTPNAGWLCWVEDSARYAYYDGSGWDMLSLDLPEIVARLGIASTADSANPLSVAGPGTLLSHAGDDHRLTINKAGPGDTASMVLQSDWSGRAEIGLTGDENLSVKVSGDGITFRTAIHVDAATGVASFPEGVSGLTPAEFGATPPVTTGYVTARGADLVGNGMGSLGNGYNFPAQFAFDPVTSPNLTAAFRFSGYHAAPAMMDEMLPIDPNQVHRLSSYIRQEGLPGDHSGYTHQDRHQHHMGLIGYDIDGNEILARHHMRFRYGSVTDSLTTLAAPLGPGDTQISLTDAAGWNESAPEAMFRGVILFGYRSASGRRYDRYSRLVEFDLFDLAGVDKAANTIALNRPLPASLANPDDPNGVWPAGTAIANSSDGADLKSAFYDAFIPPTAETWYHTVSHIGGIDRSGRNVFRNFAPGTAMARVVWLPNHSNRSGGWTGFPDTGPEHAVWFAGVSVRPSDTARLVPDATPGFDGALVIETPMPDPITGVLSLSPAPFQVTALP